MLDPQYLWYVADQVIDIWDELNEWAIKDIAERIMMAELYDYDKLPGTARWRAWLLRQSGMYYDEMVSKVAKLSHRSEVAVQNLFVEAGLMSVENDASIYKRHNIEVPDIRKDKRLTQILEGTYNQTNGELKNFTRTTIDAGNKLMIDTLDRAYFGVKTGHKSYSEAIKEAIDTTSKAGLTVTYPSGHKDTIEVAVRRAVMTGLNQGTAKISIANCEKLGAEYVVISAHEGARTSDNPIANHLGWQGKIYKLQGSTEQYPNLEDATGFPNNPLGLCGYNCRHNLYPHFLGDPNPWEDIAKKAEENKESYEIAQKQHQMERVIRKSKQQLLGYQTGIDNCVDEKTKYELQMEHDRLANRLQRQNKAYNMFCKEHDLVKESDRLRVAGWNRDTANKARSGASRYNKDDKAVAVSENNTRKEVLYNSQYDYSIKLNGYSDEVNKGLSKAAENVAKYGSRDNYEYMQLVDLNSGKLEKLITDKDRSSVGGENFWQFIKEHKDTDYAFVHNHNTDSAFSETDMRTLLTTENVKIMIAVRNDAIIYIAEREGEILKDAIFDRRYKEDINELNVKCRNGIITVAERTRLREEIIVENLLRDYTKQKGLYEINGKK
ncbi:MAG: phage minor capsid protein [Muribaculaceae bacterium]|nr:phage minor capsid protein [Muribaculaceae bacterium]MCM1399874.1 phage minor capsid protein [Clostridium sp.]MCM1460640.1 phage minor capsid protein [Bacteroides sp.]